MSEKVSTLVLKVDLECCRCCKKIKKILCKFDEIRDQVYDEKQNTVTITGYFCPHKLKKKLCCKAGDIIKCIQIKEPEKPKPEPPKKPEALKNEPPEKPQSRRKIIEPVDETGKPTSPPRKPEPPKKPDAPRKAEPKKPEPPCPTALPHGVCCGPCYEGYGGGPCYEGYRRPPPCYQGCGRPPPCYCDYGRPPPCYCGCGGMRGYVSTCKFYIQEDPATCVIM